ncbi:MAG: pilus assembly protein PilC, partial [Candidatus Rokubacteria bacterium RIFCSPHIGHO2_02_FULL_69_13]
MPFFAYQGRTTQGSTAGEIEAPDRTAAVAELRRKAILVTQIKEKAGGPARAGGVGGRFGGKVKDKEMAIFTRQFSTMVGAGLPLVQCLTILAEQSESKTLRTVTSRVAGSVEAGSTLADALRRHPKTFDELYVNLVEVGEAGGILDTVLQRLSVYIEKAAALKRKVKSAMIYPLTIVGVAFIVVIFMLTFVIPTFAKMFAGMGADLPLPTLIVIRLSDFATRFWWLIIGGAIGIVVGIRAYYRTEGGRSLIDALVLKLPVFGTLIRKVSVARFTRTLGTLVSSGVPILEGLRITARTAGNRVVERAVLETRAS